MQLGMIGKARDLAKAKREEAFRDAHVKGSLRGESRKMV